MNGKILLLIIGIVAISGIASANSNYIDIMKIITIGATDDITTHCIIPMASGTTNTDTTQTITITVPFTTSGAINGVSLGTIKVNFTTSSSQTASLTTSAVAAITGTGASLTTTSETDIISGTVPGTSFTLTDS